MIEKNTVVLGDCVEVAKQIESDSVDLILTDPPFNVDYQYNGYKDTLTDEKYRDWCVDWLTQAHRILKERHYGLIFTSDKKLYWVLDAVYKSGLNYLHLFKWLKKNSNRINYGTCLFSLVENAIVVTKGKASKNLINFRRMAHDTLEYGNISARNLEALAHPAQRPIALYKHIIEGFTKEGDLVYDFFMGSGTTAAAALSTNRCYQGSEMDPIYYEVIKQRISKIDNQLRLI